MSPTVNDKIPITSIAQAFPSSPSLNIVAPKTANANNKLADVTNDTP